MKLPALPAFNITLPPRVKRILVASAYPFFYLFCLLIFAYLTFPYERLKERLLVEFETPKAGKGSAQHLEIDAIGPYWLSGLSLKGIRVITPRSPGAEGDLPPSKLSIDEAHVRVSVFQLLIGRITLWFGGKAFGGTIDGWTRTNSDGRVLEVAVENVDIGQIDAIGDLASGLPLAGTLKGKLAWALPEQKLAKATGTVSFSIADLTAGDGKTKIAGKLALPKLNVGVFELEAEAKEGTLKVDKLGAQGQDIDLVGEGKISLRDPFADGLADLYLRFRFADGYKGKNEMTKSLFGAPGSSAPALFELADPRIRTSKRPDGFYGWHMTGAMKDPRFEPSPTGGSGASPSPGKPGALPRAVTN
ncbi:MAG TPA: type II secretion system protein GspN [Polyangiaceae bacterium]|nr:type II secretion system protein GspN [Polyangiaceae bacterium]